MTREQRYYHGMGEANAFLASAKLVRTAAESATGPEAQKNLWAIWSALLDLNSKAIEGAVFSEVAA